MARAFHINLDADPARSLLNNGFIDDSTAESPVFARSDNFTANVICFRTISGRLVNVAPPDTLKVAAGDIDATPTGGTFTLTGASGGTTSAIAYNASASTVQTVVRAALTGFGSAVVTGNAGGPWTIDRGTTGATGDITGSAAALVPSGSTVSIVNSQDGNASLNEMWQVKLARALPMLRASGWSALPVAAVSCTVIQAGVAATANKVYQVSWNQDAYGGNVLLSVVAGGTTATVGPIPYNATQEEMEDFFIAHAGITSTNNIDVQQTDVCTYTVTFKGTLANSNVPTISASEDTLLVPLGYSGDLAVATAGADALLNGEEEVDVTFEVEIRETAGLPRTVCRIMDAKFLADLIVNTPGQVTGDEDYVTRDELLESTQNFLADVTDYTGGASNDLDAVVTATKGVPALYSFTHDSSSLLFYSLETGTTAENSPYIVRPDDYNASTNTKIWKLLSFPMRSFADATERDAATPDFLGQLAFQRDNSTTYRSDGVGVGEWASIFTFENLTLDSLNLTTILTMGASGTIRLAAGSVGTPSINFGAASSDTNTGLYQVAADQIGVSLGGSNVATFANGKLGLGLTPTSGTAGSATFQVGNVTPPNVGHAWLAYFYTAGIARFGVEAATSNAGFELIEAGTRQWAFLSNGGELQFYRVVSGAAVQFTTGLVMQVNDALDCRNDVRMDKTITAGGTTGAQTINKNAGSVNFAAAATSLVVTNSRVTTSSVINATVATNDATMKSVSVVAASGSFTLHANAAATGETRVNFTVIN